MKPSARFIVSIFAATALLFGISCRGKNTGLDNQSALQLIEKINRTQNGLKIEVNAADIAVQPDEDGEKNRRQHIITLVNPSIRFDSSELKEIDLPLPEVIIQFSCSKMVLHHRPEDSYLGLSGIFDLCFDLEPETAFKNWDAGSKPLHKARFKFDCSEISTDLLNLSPLVEEGLAPLELVLKISSLNQSIEYGMTNMKLEMSFVDSLKDELKNIEMSAARISAEQKTHPVFTSLIFSLNEEKSREDVQTILSGFPDLFDVKYELEGFQFLSRRNEETEMDLGLKNASFSYSLARSGDREFFSFGSSSIIEGFGIASSGNPMIQALARLKRLESTFSIDELSPELIQIYFELMRRSQSLRMENTEEAGQEISALSLRLLGAFFQSKPEIRLSLAPLEHYFADVKAEARFRIESRAAPPQGEAEIVVYEMESLGDRLRQDGNIPEEAIEKILDFTQKYFRLDDMGNGILLFEVREEAPHAFVNGEPLRSNAS